MTLFAEHIEESDRTASELRGSYAELGTPLLDETVHCSCLADSGKVSLHICHETRHTGLTESLGQDLKRNSLTCTGCSGNQTMTVRHLSADGNRAVRTMGYIQAILFCIHILFFYEFLCLFKCRYDVREDMVRA